MVELAIEMRLSFLLVEQPEDLGVLARGPYKGQRPASMWQWPAMDKVAKLPRVTTLALHQSSFGTDYLKAKAPAATGSASFAELLLWAPQSTTTLGAT